MGDKAAKGNEILVTKSSLATKDHERERWSSRAAFLLAVIGAAVGLGNVWRFPFIVYRYGGGAFLIPYAVALFLLGVPILLLELMFGQLFQRAIVGSLVRIHPRLAGIGAAASLAAFVIASYYMVVMSWALVYSIQSFWLPWRHHPHDWFYDEVLDRSRSINSSGGMHWYLPLSLLAVWTAVFLAVFKGIHTTGKVVYVTATLPIVLLVVIFLRGVTLTGAGNGLAEFFVPDWHKLLTGSIWIEAASHVFFSFGVGTGVVAAYASFNYPKQQLVQDCLIIASADFLVSILSGATVFAVLGHMAHKEDEDIDDVVRSGPGLAFVAFPEALSLMPAPQFFSFIFFMALLLLGIDTGFSLVEGIVTVIHDQLGERAPWSEVVTKGLICFSCYSFGLLFVSSFGIYFIELFDYYTTNFVLVTVGVLQCIVAGWITTPDFWNDSSKKLAVEVLRGQTNSFSVVHVGSWFTIVIRFIAPAILLALLLYQVIHNFIDPFRDFPVWSQLVAASVVVVEAVLLIYFFLHPQQPAAVDDDDRYVELEEK